MQLNLDRMGRITAEFPATFYRVENWNTGRRVADFTTKAEADHASRPVAPASQPGEASASSARATQSDEAPK